jgi:N-methylhydantoinase A
VLGYLPPEGFANGRMSLDVEAARVAIEREVAGPLGVDVVEAAWGIERIVNANMANATRRVLAGYGADPRELAMIAYGGNGPVHAWAIARELGMGRVLVPKTAPGFSALGLLVADYAVDIQKSYVVPLSQVDVEVLQGLLAELTDEADKELAPAGLPAEDVDEELFVQMAYPGQNFDMSVPCPPDLVAGTRSEAALLDLAARFHDQHETDRGFAFRNQQPVVRGVRLVGRGRTDKPDHLGEVGAITTAGDATIGTRQAWFDDGFVPSPVIDGTRLGPGAVIEGPALVQEPFTVLVVPPGASATLGDHASYELTL